MAAFFRFELPEEGREILMNVEQIVRISTKKGVSGAKVDFIDGSHQDLPEDAWQKFKRSPPLTDIFFVGLPKKGQ